MRLVKSSNAQNLAHEPSAGHPALQLGPAVIVTRPDETREQESIRCI